MLASPVRPVGWQRRSLACLPYLVGLAIVLLGDKATADDQTGAPAPTTCQQLTRTETQGQPADLQLWQAALQACQKDADFLAALGQMMNRRAQFTEAVDHLERALLLDPSRKDAQLAYALALAGAGDLLSAQAFLQDLLRDEQLPADLRQKIEQQLAGLVQRQDTVAQKSKPQGAWDKRLTFTARYGQDSNLLGSPDLASLNLTIGGQTLTLPLDQQYLAKKESYVRLDAQLEMATSLAGGSRLELVASLRQRTSPSESRGNNTQADVLLEQNKLSAGFYWQALMSSLNAQTGVRYQVSGIGAGFSAEKIGKCAARWGLESQERTYFNAPVLSGSYTGLALASVCDWGWNNQALLTFRHGLDQAKDPVRPGGDQRISSLRALVYMPLSWWGTDSLLLDLEQAIQQDSQGYSNLLENGSARGVQRQAVRLEYQKGIAQGLQWLAGLERLNQSSNLELFKTDNTGLYTSLRWVW